MTLLVILGAITTLVGLAGLVFCIRRAAAAKAMRDDPDAQRRALSGLVALNMASVGVAFLGLAIVVLGLVLAPS